MGRNEAFEQAKRERQLQEANRGSGSFEKQLSAALPTNKKDCKPENMQWAQLRCLGNPADFRGGDPTAAKRYLMAQAVADNGKKMYWIFPPKTDDSHWAWRIINTVLARHWDDKNKGYVYHHTDRAIFQKAFDNGTGNKMDKGWMPKELVKLNVLDRAMMAVHREQQACAVLCSGASELPNGQMFYNSGIPKMLYELIWGIVEAADDYNDYDILVKKIPVNPFYEVKHIEEGRFAVGAKPLMEYGTAPLTEEELSWKRWDIDASTQITTATKALKRMEKLFNEVDITFKQHFVEELRDLAAKEAQEKLEAQKNGEQTLDEAGEDDEAGETQVSQAQAPASRQSASAAPVFPAAAPVTPQVATRSLPTPTPTPAAVAVRQPVAPPSVFDHPVVRGFAGISKLTPEERALAVAVDDDGVISWSDPELSGCPTCGYTAPTAVHCCPSCGQDFV